MQATLHKARLIDDKLTAATQNCALNGEVAWRNEYNELDMQMPAIFNSLNNSQSHLVDRAGYWEADTWNKNQVMELQVESF